MGHWSEDLVGQLLAELPPGADEERVRQMLREVGAEIELLSGRAFGVSTTSTIEFDSGGYPFVEVPDLQLDGLESSDLPIWPIPDPVHPHTSVVAQVVAPLRLVDRADSVASALAAGGSFVNWAYANGRLSRDYVIAYLGHAFDPDRRLEYLKRLLDPEVKLNIPIGAVMGPGWWLQITRRLVLVSHETRDEQRLLEPLFDQGGEIAVLAATEPVLILARVNEHPASWAIAIRIWPDIDRTADRPWRILAKAIHGSGIPILTVDAAATRAETACQMELVAYWHGYLTGNEPELPGLLAAAYPEAINRIKRSARLERTETAVALLLNRLLHPGFDPVRGTNSSRRYINRIARTVALEHLKTERAEFRPWETLGLKERHYYKLLARYAHKAGRRYEVDDSVRPRIREHVEAAERRRAAIELLVTRGFSVPAARKWVQRHSVSEISASHPRPRQRADPIRRSPIRVRSRKPRQPDTQ